MAFFDWFNRGIKRELESNLERQLASAIDEMVEERDLIFEFDTGSTNVGSTATPDNVTGIPAVFSAVNIVANNIAKLDLNVWQKNKDESREIDEKHSLSKVLRGKVNPYQTRFDFIRTVVNHYLLWGNAYILPIFDNRANVIELWNLDPASTNIQLNTKHGRVMYNTIRPITNESMTLGVDQIVHLKHMSKDGITGRSPISITAEMLGAQLSMDKHMKAFYDNGTLTTHVLKTDELLSSQAKYAQRAAWEKMNGGIANAHRVAVLDGGFDIQPLSMPMKDMEFVATKQFNLRQVASIFNVPPHLIGDSSGLKYSNIESQNMSFLQECLSPILVMMETAFSYELLRPDERKKFILEFDTSDLTRGDSIARATYYEKMAAIKALTSDEIRRLEGWNPLTDEQKKEFEPSKEVNNNDGETLPTNGGSGMSGQ